MDFHVVRKVEIELLVYPNDGVQVLFLDASTSVSGTVLSLHRSRDRLGA